MENFYLENSGFVLYSPSHLIFKSNFLGKLVLMFKEDVKPPFLTSERKKHILGFPTVHSSPSNSRQPLPLLIIMFRFLFYRMLLFSPTEFCLSCFQFQFTHNFWTCFPSADTFIFFAVHTEWVLKLREELPLWKLYLWFESILGPHPSHGTMCLEMTTMTLKGTG